MSDTQREVVETFGDSEQFDAEPLERIAGTVDDERRERTESAEKAESTQQHDVDDHEGPRYYFPPYPPEKLALTCEQSETAARCTTAIGKGVAGYGFDFEPADTAESDDPPGLEAVEQFWRSGDFQLGPDALISPPEKVLEHVYTDRVKTGYGTLEILLNDATYTPTGAAHVPSYTIRKRREKAGYVQLDDGRPVQYYGPAGGRDNGVYVDVDGNVGGSRADVPKTLANELLVTTEYSSLAPHYGIALVVPALQTLSADLAAREYQYRFFSNDGVPRFMVIVEGGELTERAWEQLEEKLKDLKGAEDAHRGILIEATGDAVAGPEDSVTVRIEPLTVGETEEMGFIEYRKENEHSISQAFNVPPVVRGRTEDVNYATAREQRRQFAQSELGPRQSEFGAQLTKTIHETMLGVDGWDLEFELKGGDNALRDSEIAINRTEAARGSMTVDDARSELGLEPIEGTVGETLLAELGGSGSSGGFGGGSDDSDGGDSQEQMRSTMRTERLMQQGREADAED